MKFLPVTNEFLAATTHRAPNSSADSNRFLPPLSSTCVNDVFTHFITREEEQSSGSSFCSHLTNDRLKLMALELLRCQISHKSLSIQHQTVTDTASLLYTCSPDPTFCVSSLDNQLFSEYIPKYFSIQSFCHDLEKHAESIQQNHRAFKDNDFHKLLEENDMSFDDLTDGMDSFGEEILLKHWSDDKQKKRNAATDVVFDASATNGQDISNEIIRGMGEMEKLLQKVTFGLNSTSVKSLNSMNPSYFYTLMINAWFVVTVVKWTKYLRKHLFLIASVFYILELLCGFIGEVKNVPLQASNHVTEFLRVAHINVGLLLLVTGWLRRINHPVIAITPLTSLELIRACDSLIENFRLDFNDRFRTINGRWLTSTNQEVE